MKRITYILLCAVFLTVSCGKDDDGDTSDEPTPSPTSQKGYGLSHSVVSYNELTGASEVTDVSWTCSNAEAINLNFDFPFFNTTYDRVLIHGGRIEFGSSDLSYIAAVAGHCLEGFGDDLSYKIDGSTGNRILKIQWKDAEIEAGGSGSYSGEFVNVQAWLYETGKIEIRFGEINVIDGGTTWAPLIGISNDNIETFYIRGAADNPCFEINPSNGYHTITVIPVKGTIYTLMPDGIGGECVF